MLCLTLDENRTGRPGPDDIIIRGRNGEEITVVVLMCDGGRVKLGIDAPRDVAIHRRGAKVKQ